MIVNKKKKKKKKKEKKKKRTCRIVDLAHSVDHRVKLKESGKRDKCLELAWVLKELGDMKLMVIPIVIVTLFTVTKGLIQGLEDLEKRGRVETIQNTVLLRSSEY